MSRQIRIMPNWKAPGRDGVQGVCIKNLTSLLSRIAEQLDRMLGGSDKIPQDTVGSFGSIYCLPLMWIVVPGLIAEGMYSYLESHKLLPDE